MVSIKILQVRTATMRLLHQHGGGTRWRGDCLVSCRKCFLYCVLSFIRPSGVAMGPAVTARSRQERGKKDRKRQKGRARAWKKLNQPAHQGRVHKWFAMLNERTMNGELTVEAVRHDIEVGRGSVPHGGPVVHSVHWGAFNQDGLGDFITVQDRVKPSFSKVLAPPRMKL